MTVPLTSTIIMLSPRAADSNACTGTALPINLCHREYHPFQLWRLTQSWRTALEQHDLSKHPQSSMATFPNSVAPVWPLWLEQASNVKVVVGDLFATPNLLKSHTERNLLSPYSNIRAVTSKLCACPSLAIVAHHWS